MRFALTTDQKNFFVKSGWIRFENLFTSEELKAIQEAVMGARVKFDLFRSTPLLAKWIQGKHLGTLGCELIGVSTLRVGCDRTIAHPLELESDSLEEISCAKPLGPTFLIPLSSEYVEVVCVASQKKLDWGSILSPCSYYLITYAAKNSLYYLEKNDPHTHAWKKLGYGFGDHLNDTLHPLCR